MLGSERARLLAALDLLQNWVSWPSEIGENTINGRNPANPSKGCRKPSKLWDIYYIHWLAVFLPSIVW